MSVAAARPSGWQCQRGCCSFENYDAYLASPHWRELRERILERAENRCQVCNANESGLHVHHRTYERVGHEKDSDLTVLCVWCHDLFHGARTKPKRNAKQAKRKSSAKATRFVERPLNIRLRAAAVPAPRALPPIGLRPDEVRILEVLRAGHRSATQIGTAIFKPPGTVGQLLAPLREKGCVIKVSKRWYLADDGRIALARIESDEQERAKLNTPAKQIGVGASAGAGGAVG